MYYFEDAEMGTTRNAGPYLVSKEEIIQFAKQYDPIPRHIDEEAAACSIIGGLTAWSAHTFAVFISLTPKLQPRPLHVLAGMGWDELRLPNPVRPGEMNLISKRLFWRSWSQNRNLIAASCAIKSDYATKETRSPCNASASSSLQGDQTRKHPRKLL
ncbi:MaoC/PaaZ C-terminal domain-containing protein [Bradyrhizobium sp. PMVTL-01]|uniref:MaoC/PaaZ C-terminal domain-containing protein n=1 Tax=Bradyrhizobium sp. PMVTL-01 TaxID=3434999 RepID=UPI003F72BFC9